MNGSISAMAMASALAASTVVAGPSAGVGLDVDPAAVGLVQPVVEVGEPLDGLSVGLRVDVGPGPLHGRGGSGSRAGSAT